MLKSFSVQLASVARNRRGRRNLRVLASFFLLLATMVTIYSITFHLLMQMEGQEHSWITGFYWTLTVMSTLGFGDITFQSDIGRLFSMVVLISGTIFMLVLLPFTFIEFFYDPWMKAQAETRAPRRLPPGTRDHVLLTSHDSVATALIRRLQQYKYPYALVVPDVDEALNLHDLGLNVMVGDLDSPETWKNARASDAALLASTSSDVTNTNVAFTVRGLADKLPIITSAFDASSVDVLKLAGSSYVLRLEEMIGQSFARRTLGGDAKSHMIGKFDELLIAEATAHDTPLVGKTLRESGLRQNLGITVVGVWERGRFEPARAETMINNHTVLVLAGSKEHMTRYDELFCIYNVSSEPVVIVGGGRVGRATARALARRNVDYRIVEPRAERVSDPEKCVIGSAADLEVLEKAGIRKTSTVIITPHDDDLNVYLTIYCRQLRPDVQILSRATHERNVAKMHRAGADSVLSYASIGTSVVMNLLQRSTILMVAEGLNLFKVRVPGEFAGKTIGETSIRETTGCSVVAIRTERGMEVVPSPSAVLSPDADIVLIGTTEAEEHFLKLYGKGGPDQ